MSILNHEEKLRILRKIIQAEEFSFLHLVMSVKKIFFGGGDSYNCSRFIFNDAPMKELKKL